MSLANFVSVHTLTQSTWESHFTAHDQGVAARSLRLDRLVPADPGGVLQRQQLAAELVGHAASVQELLPYEVVQRICTLLAESMKWPLTRGLLQPDYEWEQPWAMRHEQQQACSSAEIDSAEWWRALHGPLLVPACSLFATMSLAAGVDAAIVNAEAVRVQMNQLAAPPLEGRAKLSAWPEKPVRV